MPNKFTIDIGPDGFQAPGKKPKFKVKDTKKVVFNLVNGATPVNVYFSSGSPFGSDPVIPVGSSGSGELTFQPGTVDRTFSMQVQAPTTDDTALKLMNGPAGEIEVEKGP
jgi:hypothetical protein